MRGFAGIVLALAAGIGAAAAADVKGSADHPLVPRYEGSEIILYGAEEFTDHSLRAGPKKDTSLALEGKVTRITYKAPKDRSSLEVLRNYETALKAAGFIPIFSCAKRECGDIPRDIESGPRYMALSSGGSVEETRYLAAKKETPAGDVYASVFVTKNRSGGPNKDLAMIQLDVVELKPMDEKMVVLEAAALKNDIAAEGRVAVYGVLFDFDKDTINPDSKPQLDEIAKLLKASPELKVMIVGHTDAKGAADYNRDLSARRARSVVDALVDEYGIAAGRLTPVGVGMAAPVATNRTEEGRAKNRRVELVDIGT